MNRTLTCAVISAFLLASCGYYYPSNRNPYGTGTVLYGDWRHPGIDWDVSTGTPVIAASDGDVVLVWESVQWGGYSVRISHGEHFDSWYGHLAEVHVQFGQSVKRGQLIGLSGADYTGRQYLHFGICRRAGSCTFFPDTYDPGKYWLGAKPRCFDPGIDYTRFSQPDITVPVACGAYERELIARAKEKRSR